MCWLPIGDHYNSKEETQVVNSANVTALADFIENNPTRSFNMKDWDHCIGGYLHAMQTDSWSMGFHDISHASNSLANFLGIELAEAKKVIMPTSPKVVPGFTRAMAVDMLRRLSVTGRTEWYAP